MKLTFTCPKAQVAFTSDEYSLLKGHRIVEDEHGVKQLHGRVSLHSECPFCGQKHMYEVKDVLCPLTPEKNEE